MPRDLHEKRFAAALASKGTSSEAIYGTALTLLATLNQAGDLLEFGAGTGHLIMRLLEAGYKGKLTGADILPRPNDLPLSVTWI